MQFSGKLKSYLEGKRSADIFHTKLCMQRTKNNFKGNFENITCRACKLGLESFQHIIKNHTKRSMVEHIYSDDCKCLRKYASAIMKFMRRV